MEPLQLKEKRRELNLQEAKKLMSNLESASTGLIDLIQDMERSVAEMSDEEISKLI